MTAGDEARSRDLAAEFAALGPWVFKFRIGEIDFGGEISAVGDERLEQFWRFAPEARRILELGSLEGAHTVQLASRSEVVAIEGRANNIAKAELVRQALQVENARFVQANLEETDLVALGEFDAVFCAGLLYHLPEPWKLIEQTARVAPKLFLWTHYADDLLANEIRHGCRGQLHREGGPNEPLSGMSETAFWPTLGSLLKLVRTSGYETVEIIKNDPSHQNAPAVTIAATKSGSARGCAL